MSLQEALTIPATPIDPADPRALRDAFGRFATGVTIVTTRGPDGPVAIAANSFSSVSLDPPLVLWSVAKGSRRFGFFDAARHYAIHVLAADQAGLCHEVSQNLRALQDAALSCNAEDVPLIDGCLARFECRRTNGYDAGDHVIILGEVLRTEMRAGDALTFFGGRYGEIAQG